MCQSESSHSPQHSSSSDEQILPIKRTIISADQPVEIPESGRKNIPILEGLPIAEMTANLRYGPNLHDAMLALLPLVGVWRGTGQGVRSTATSANEFSFGQELIIGHDGNSYLNWSSVIWEIPPTAGIQAPILTRESGYLRISESDEIELLLSHSEGFVEIYYGSPRSQTSWELATDVVIQAGSAGPTGGAKRLYGLVNSGDLAYVEERISPDGELVPVYSAQLVRYIG